MKPSGFYLMEMLIAMGVAGIMAAAAYPYFKGTIAAAKTTLAKEDIHAISKAIVTFNEQTHSYPGMIGTYDILQSKGNDVYLSGDGGSTVWGIGGAKIATIADVLIDNNHGYAPWDSDIEVGWQGPYLEADPSDPWDNKYQIRIKGFADDSEVWVLSAGSNEVIETSDTALELGGDDIGGRIQ